MASSDPTYIGQVASVTGGVIRVRLRQDMPTTLVLVDGESYRVGQIGGFFQIPIGYTRLYAVCSQVGADAMPVGASTDPASLERETSKDDGLAGYRWMTVVLFGESSGGRFERGVGQYPTVGDEVHFVTSADLAIVYGRQSNLGLTIGRVASTGGIPATLDLDRFVSRHCAIVGSTGAGKSNLMSVILEELAAGSLPASRVLVIDPHGEYAHVAPGRAAVFRITPGAGEHALVVPYWALPFDELLAITFGPMSPANEAVVRDLVQEMKRAAAIHLNRPPAIETITADSPIPFSIRKLWFELDDFERSTYRKVGNERVKTAVITEGDAERLIPNVYPIHGPGAQEPFKNPSPRGIGKQLELARSRLTDSRYAFLFSPGELRPTSDGRVAADVDELVASWVGGNLPLSVLDVSELPSEVASDVVGLLLRIVYDTLFWAGGLPVSGKSQPLLIVVDEAHRFVPEGGDGSCHRILRRVAKEGRKYGVGLAIVTQRPSEIDATILSQCGTMIALRTTNTGDRSRVAGSFPDDLGGLVELLPSLRTGEALLVGEAMFVPSRVRVRLTRRPESNADPKASIRWALAPRPGVAAYSQALESWRRQTKG